MVEEFIDDYEDAWGVRVPFDDAVLMLSLHDGLCILLEKYAGDDDDDCPPWWMIRH